MDKKVPTKSRFGRFLDFLASTCTLLSGISMVVLVSTFGWLVYGRYILNATPTWVEQLSLLLMITITFLSSAAGVRERTHLSVDIVPLMCRARTRLYLKIFTDLVLAGFGALMAVQAVGLLEFSWYKKIPLLDIPEGVRYIPVVVSGTLVALFSIGSIARELSSLSKVKLENPEPVKMAEE